MKKIVVLLLLVSLSFVSYAKKSTATMERAYFAGGCFWGVEYFMQQCKGVINTTSGLMGETDDIEDAEVVEVVFNPTIVTYKDLAKIFFEIHDPTQLNRQGEDEGVEYRSEIFYCNPQQKKIA
ncbi:MAG: peptide-methionine (S)-S-oxide reductase, partial [Rikenellaceae bacterium]